MLRERVGQGTRQLESEHGSYQQLMARKVKEPIATLPTCKPGPVPYVSMHICESAIVGTAHSRELHSNQFNVSRDAFQDIKQKVSKMWLLSMERPTYGL